MEARELRVGNYINYEQTTHIITNIGLECSLSLWMSDDDKHEEIFYHANKYLKPIPLTEKWLLKFGFSNMIVNEDYYVKPIDGEMTLNGEDFIFSLKWKRMAVDLDPFITCIGFEINHVHQLQNLYFALTGKEL